VDLILSQSRRERKEGRREKKEEEGRKKKGEGYIAFYDMEPPPSPNLSREG